MAAPPVPSPALGREVLHVVVVPHLVAAVLELLAEPRGLVAAGGLVGRHPIVTLGKQRLNECK